MPTLLKIQDFSTIQFGLHAKPVEDGDTFFLLAKHFNNSGNIISEIDSKIKIGERERWHLLKDGDVIFTGKGFRSFAWCYRESFGAAVASSIFYVIRPDQSEILPEYLCALLNLEKNKNYFLQLGAGFTIPSIRKNEVAEFNVPLISMENQKRVAAIQKLHQQEMSLMNEITQQKINLHQSIITKICN